MISQVLMLIYSFDLLFFGHILFFIYSLFLMFSRHVQERVLKILKTDKQKLPEDRKASLLCATTMHEVEHLVSAENLLVVMWLLCIYDHCELHYLSVILVYATLSTKYYLPCIHFWRRLLPIKALASEHMLSGHGSWAWSLPPRRCCRARRTNM